MPLGEIICDHCKRLEADPHVDHSCMNHKMEETRRAGLRKAEPTNVDPDSAGLVHWHQCYGDLWEAKVSFEKEHISRSIRASIGLLAAR